MCNAIFVVKIRFQHFGVVGVDGDLHPQVKQLLERMLFNCADTIGEIVAPWIHFKGDVVFLDK